MKSATGHAQIFVYGAECNPLHMHCILGVEAKKPELVHCMCTWFISKDRSPATSRDRLDHGCKNNAVFEFGEVLLHLHIKELQKPDGQGEPGRYLTNNGKTQCKYNSYFHMKTIFITSHLHNLKPSRVLDLHQVRE